MPAGFRVALLFAAGALSALTGCGAPPASLPDVVLVTVDTLRADHLGAYGYAAARTPVFDRLAAAGVRFDAALAPIPRTTPALASLMTGRTPAVHGSREVGDPIAFDLPALADLFAARGYRTAAVSANFAAGPPQKLDRGFAHFLRAERLRRLRSEGAAGVTSRTLALVSRLDPGPPLFLWVHYVDPHFPYNPPPPFRPAQGFGPCDVVARLASRIGRGPVYANENGVAARALDSCIEAYDGEIAYTDAEIGRLLAGLDLARRGRSRLLVVTADHGENLGEDQLFFEHGPSLHDASIRVPLVFHGGGIQPRVDRSVALLEDVAPTLLAWAGLPANELPRFDGIDLFVRSAADRSERHAFVESGSALRIHSPRYISGGYASGWHCTHGPRFALCEGDGRPPGLFERASDPDYAHDLAKRYPDEVRVLAAARARWPPETPRARGVRTPAFKLIETPRFEGGYRRALYDVTADAEEATDVAREHRAESVRLGALLDEWTRALPMPRPLDLSSNEIAELRALGYLN